MKIDIIKKLAESSPFEGERQAAKEALTRLTSTGRDIKEKIDLERSVIYFRYLFAPLYDKWINYTRLCDYSHERYEVHRKIWKLDKDFELSKGRFLFNGLMRHGGNDFSIMCRRLTIERNEKKFTMKTGILPASEIIYINSKVRTRTIDYLEEFLQRVSFSSTKKLPHSLS